MNSPQVSSSNISHTPPKKKRCGCFLTGCLSVLIVLFLIGVGSGIGFYYTLKNAGEISDEVVEWTYTNVARPKIMENIPPHLSEREKQQILETSDNAVQTYLKLPREQKKIILKEGMVASYYLSQDKSIPPEKIPNLTIFIREQIQAYKGKRLKLKGSP